MLGAWPRAAPTSGVALLLQHPMDGPGGAAGTAGHVPKNRTTEIPSASGAAPAIQPRVVGRKTNRTERNKRFGDGQKHRPRGNARGTRLTG